jgi:hypothetical protein
MIVRGGMERIGIEPMTSWLQIGFALVSRNSPRFAPML